MSEFHKPVLLQEALHFLRVTAGKHYIDATLGGGGHAFEIVRLGGEVLGIDWDEDSLSHVSNKWSKESKRLGIDKKSLAIANGNFRDIKRIAKKHELLHVAGIVFDLGLSSHQVDTPKRGFSFQRNAPLDMRMDTSLAVTAKDLVNALSKKELCDLFTRFGEERNAWSIAEDIVRHRKLEPITTTEELARIVEEAQGIHDLCPSPRVRAQANARVFQALRIAVNDEMSNLEKALPDAIDLLELGGRLAVISFHSQEDRIVKNTFGSFEQKHMGWVVTKKPVYPSSEEVQGNTRSRSSKLRVFEKI